MDHASDAIHIKHNDLILVSSILVFPLPKRLLMRDRTVPHFVS